MDANSEPNSSENGSAKSANGGAGASNGTSPRLPGAAGTAFHGGSSHHHAVVPEGFVQILVRRWPLIAAVTVLAIVVGLIYAFAARRIYTSTAQLQVDPINTESIASSNNSNANNNNSNSVQTPADFLQTQCVEIQSSAVLALAIEKAGHTKTLSSVARPMDYLKSHLTAEPHKLGQIIDLTFEGPNADESQVILDAVVDAYKKFASDSWNQYARNVMDVLNAGAVDRANKIAAEQSQKVKLALALGFTPAADPTHNPDAMEVQVLNDALSKANAELADATIANTEAGNAVVGNPDLVQMLAAKEDEKQPTSTDPADDLKRCQVTLQSERARLAVEARHYLPNHPIIKAYQGRIADMTVDVVISAKQWVEAAKIKVEAANQRVADAEQIVRDHQPQVDEFTRLSQDIARQQTINGDVESREKQLDITRGAGALNIVPLERAELQPSLTKPEKGKTLAIAAVMGLLLGVAVACLVDWADDRVRTSADLQAAAMAPVLGAIPEITTAATAADRGQIVHHDPFGIAAESYRTLATAVQFGLPPRTKTILITSAVSGDGKSTLVSNLGLSLAQAGKRVLIVDADFRAPMQHRLFDLKDRIGLSTVLAGGERVERAIQRTETEGLDVLGCGPLPANPSEVLNDPAFAEYLNELADKYDLVLIDSPPVTAVADARILAVSADVSMLVVRPEKSTRKQIAAARDGLRSVGARLFGVAVNAVHRRSGFAGASGYYPRPGMIAGPARRRTPAATPDTI
jgi:succinoglycan biosynthesis transport protein ExoP